MKIDWQASVSAVQPRLRLGRSFDQRHHEYLGYALRVRGEFDGRPATAWLGVGKAAHAKQHFEVGQEVAGGAEPVADPRLEVVDYYKVGGLNVKEGTASAPGPTRKVPGRGGMSFDEGDRVDEQETEHRGPDD